jgi:CDP-6-deoxy-D-xylo-4-hexulose-3-dehydrase
MAWRYPLTHPDGVTAEAVADAVACLQSGAHTMGARVEAFEQAIAAAVNARHAIMVNSGSSANLLAVEALVAPSSGRGVWRAGDRIAVPALCWPTSVWPLVQRGLVPVFVDIEPHTLGIDADQVPTSIAGVVLIHVMGCPAQATLPLLRRGLLMLEDTCESFGARLAGQACGTFGVIGTYSHYLAHQVTSIEGGTVIANADSVADDVRSMRSHGWTRQRQDRQDEGRWSFVTTGYNVRPVEVTAAVGLAELRGFEAVRIGRRMRAAQMRRWLAAAGLTVPFPEDDGVSSTGYRQSLMYVPVLASSAAHQAAAVAHLTACGVETRPILTGNFLAQPVMRQAGYDPTRYPVTNDVAARGFLLGCHPATDGAVLEEALSRVPVA